MKNWQGRRNDKRERGGGVEIAFLRALSPKRSIVQLHGRRLSNCPFETC